MSAHKNMLWGAGCLMLCAFLFTGIKGCAEGNTVITGKTDGESNPMLDQGSIKPSCPNGVDQDKDGYGDNCPGGADCDDTNNAIHPGAKEICDQKDNNCNKLIDEDLPGCQEVRPSIFSKMGDDPFPMDTSQDPNLVEVDGVGVNENGDLILNQGTSEFHFMWIANSKDLTRGTISKVDTRSMKEVGRFYTVTCHSNGIGADCKDLHGRAIDRLAPHRPSRTAVDFNFDVWVANRAHQDAADNFITTAQASVTKISNDPTDCIDRNNNGKIDTSTDLNGDGKIDTASAEFLGDDDECVIFTVNFDQPGAIGRSICLQPDKALKPSHAWVGTYGNDVNNFYKVDGQSGALSGPFPLPQPHRVYGCAVDSQGILWSVNRNNPQGTMVALNTHNPSEVSPVMTSPWEPSLFYGVAVGMNDQIWIGGQFSGRTYRYHPDRSSFSTLHQGAWTGVVEPTGLGATRGIAPDNRGWVWVAFDNGYIWRIPQNIGGGLQDLSASTDLWQIQGTEIAGVGVDFDGHIWGISSATDQATKLFTDAAGNPLLPAGSQATDVVEVGDYPYTYSDFTGFGLKTFTNPQGRYRYQLEPCPVGVKAKWIQILWNATVPPGTTISVKARAGDSMTSFGDWVGPYQSPPALLDGKSATPMDPNPAKVLQLEFILETSDKDKSPILHSFEVEYSCEPTVD